MRIKEDIDPSGAEIMTNFNTATRHLQYVYKEMGMSYQSATRRCLTSPPDLRDSSLDSQEFQTAVYDKIVLR